MADRDATLIHTLRQFFITTGRRVQVALNAETAAALLDRHSPDLVVVGFDFPSPRAVDIVRLASSLATTPAVIAIARTASAEAAWRAAECGAVGCVITPIDVQRLGALVEQVSERRQQLVERDRVQAAQEERAHEFETLLDIAGLVNSTLELKPLLRAIARRAAQAIGCDRCSVNRFDGDAIVPLMSQFADGHADPAMWDKFKALGPRAIGDVPAIRLAIERRGPVIVEDAATSPLAPAYWTELFGITSCLIVPLIRRDEVVGTLSLDQTTAPQPFSDAQVRLAMTIASQVALAVENARLYQAVTSRLTRVQALTRLNQLVSSSLDREDVLREITNAAAGLMDAPFSLFWLADADDETLEIVAFSDPALAADFPVHRLAYDQGIVGWIARHQTTVHIPDVFADDRFAALGWWQAQGLTSFFGIPVVHDGRLLAVLALHDRRPFRFESEDEDVLKSFVAQAAVAIRNADLFAQSERRRHAAEALAAVSRALAQSLDSDVIGEQIVDSVRTLLGADASALYRQDRDSGNLVVVASTGRAAGVLTKGGSAPRGGAGELAAREGRPVSTRDILNDSRFATTPEMRARLEHLDRAVLSVPLMVHDTVIGALSVGATLGRVFDDEDVRLTQAFADQAAIAMENARLYQAVASRLTRLETLTRLNQLISSSLDRQAVLQEITNAAARLMDATVSSFWMADPDRRTLTVVAFSDSAMAADFPTPSLTYEQGTIGWIARHLEWLSIPDVFADGRVATGEWWRAHGLTSFFGVPVVHNGKLLAVLALNGRRAFSVEDDDRSLIESFIAQAAVAIRNARLFEHTEKRRRTAEALAEVGRALASSLDPDVVGRQVTESVRALFGVHSAGLLLCEADTGFLRTLSVSREEAAPGTIVTTVARGVGAVGRAVAERRPFATPDLLTDERVMLTPEFRAMVEADGYRAALALPLLTKDGVLGVLSLRAEIGRTFDAEEVRLAQAFADQAALAVQNARLYDASQAQREQLAQIFESTSDGIMLVRADRRIEAANSRAAELLDLALDEIRGRDFVELLAERAGGADRAAVSALSSLIPEGGSTESDLALPSLKRVVHWVAQASRDAAGAPGDLTVTLHDVTREREVAEMKNDFVSFVTHQLRTPLSGIKWMLELAGQEPGLSEAADSYIQDAHGASRRLITLVNELLDISRLEAGRIDVTPKPMDLAAVTRALADEVRPLVGDKEHQLILALESVPVVMADPQLIYQVVLNLASNAIKYTPPGGTITIQLRQSGGAVQWSIEDSGIGIPRAAQARLFEKFYRADNVFTIETEGTGLGLYLVRLIVDRFGGRVWCESEEGRGATFVFTLPHLTA